MRNYIKVLYLMSCFICDIWRIGNFRIDMLSWLFYGMVKKSVKVSVDVCRNVLLIKRVDNEEYYWVYIKFIVL